MATFNPIKTNPTVPIIHQSEAAECGLACLAMVATYYGYETDIRHLRSRFLVSLKGTTLKGLMDIAGKLGLSSRPVRLELDNLSDLSTPAILHWGLNHFVVLVKTSRNYAVLRDPARGSVKLPMDEVSKFFTGIALELRPTPLFEEKKDITPVRITDFWQRIRGLKGSLIKVFVLSLMLQLIALVMPLFQQLVVDDAITKQDVDFLMVLALGFAILGIINLVIGWLRSYLVLYFSTTLNFQMKLNLFRHVLRLPIDFFEKRHMGDITSRFGSINPIANLFTSGFIAIVLDGIMAIGTVIMAFTYSVKLTAIVFLFLLINFFIQLMTMPYLKRKNEEILHLSAKVETNFLESLRAVRAVKLFNQESTRESQWQNLTIDSLNARVTLSKFTINLGVLTGLWVYFNPY
jgi:ATP-binding cassette subfamily B protein RaxB